MSFVRCKNKNVGRISVYESTSDDDAANKTSGLIRTQIGYEDPLTGEFIPGSEKPGRRKKAMRARLHLISKVKIPARMTAGAQFLKSTGSV
jgi:hypothetical protein